MQITIVRPGETVTIALDRARTVRSRGCHARDLSCIGEAHVTPRGCPTRTIARVFLEPGRRTEWRAVLDPGDYEVHVFAYFQADDGRSGDVSAAFGLRVDPGTTGRIVPATATPADCR